MDDPRRPLRARLRIPPPAAPSPPRRPAPPASDDPGASLRRVATHEYGHLHVARAFGIAGRVQITPRNARARDGLGERFAGCFVPSIPLIECHAAQIIALAGACADARLAAAGPLTAAGLYAALAGGERGLSDADAAFAGAYRCTHVAEALGLVLEAWLAIVRDAALHALAIEQIGGVRERSGRGTASLS